MRTPPDVIAVRVNISYAAWERMVLRGDDLGPVRAWCRTASETLSAKLALSPVFEAMPRLYTLDRADAFPFT